MKNPDSKLDYDGVKFYGINDLSNSWELKKAETVLNSFNPDKKYENINEVIELYNVQKFINSGVILRDWTQQQCQNYKDKVRLFPTIFGKFFSQVNDDNFLKTISSVAVLYIDNFWTLFVQFKAYKKISGDVFKEYLHLFKMFDLHFRSSLVAVKSEISAIEKVFTVQGLKFYPKGIQFEMKDMKSLAETELYYNFLKNHNINLEEVFKWFFEVYLPEEFGAYGFSMMVSSSSSTYIEKCRSLASEMEGILKQFRMFVQDGTIDRELFEISSEHMVIGNIPSLIPCKYAYPKSEKINSEMHALFSNQTALECIKKQSQSITHYLN